MVDHEEASEQGLAKPAVRGIDWTEVFRQRPELSPPGYTETCEAIRLAKLKAVAED